MDGEQLGAYVEYLRDLGVYELYRSAEPSPLAVETALRIAQAGRPAVAAAAAAAGQAALGPATAARPKPADVLPRMVPAARPSAAEVVESEQRPMEPPMGRLISFNDLAPLPEVRLEAGAKAAALQEVRERIGDCTRCPLAYAGRRTIVFGDGDPHAELMFVGEGPGADEDASGIPFVGKAGQLLNNMIGAMGLRREQVYIANIVKCRPPGNRVPEPGEANTCSQFLLEQMDIVRPKVVVALGSTAATYLLGVRQSLTSMRGRWQAVRGAKLLVTFHPAYLLRDPRQKGEAWKDLQMVMKELELKAPVKG